MAFIPGILVGSTFGRGRFREIGLAVGDLGYLFALVPLALGLLSGFYLIWTRKLARRPVQESLPHADDLPRLVVIRCSSCGTPLPISASRPICPACGTADQIPAEYTETLSLREQAASRLRQAEKRWRRVQLIDWLPLPLYCMARWPMSVRWLAP